MDILITNVILSVHAVAHVIITQVHVSVSLVAGVQHVKTLRMLVDIHGILVQIKIRSG